MLADLSQSRHRPHHARLQGAAMTSASHRADTALTAHLLGLIAGAALVIGFTYATLVLLS